MRLALRFLLPAFALGLFGVVLNLSGCAGGEGCSASIGIEASSRYAGSYTATYTPTDPAQGEALTIAFTLDASGQLTGTATGTTGDATLSVRAGPIRSGCDLTGAGIDLTLVYDGGRVEFLRSNKDSRTRLDGTFDTQRYSPDAAISVGGLVATKG